MNAPGKPPPHTACPRCGAATFATDTDTQLLRRFAPPPLRGESAPEKPLSIKEAYERFLEAMEAAGFERSDGEVAKRLMETGTGRRRTASAPYTAEEFMQVAAQLSEAAARRAPPLPRAA